MKDIEENLSTELRGAYEEDLESRSEWEETYTKGPRSIRN